MGSSGFGYKIAEQFGLKIVPPRAALVPLTFDAALLAQFKELSGVSVDAVVSCGKARFDEALLFTHRGLSGPAILQISSYWREGQDIVIDMAPGTDVLAGLKAIAPRSSEAGDGHGAFRPGAEAAGADHCRCDRGPGAARRFLRQAADEGRRGV